MRLEKLIERYNLQILYLQEAIGMYREAQKKKKNTLRYSDDIKRYCSNAKWLKKEIEYLKKFYI